MLLSSRPSSVAIAASLITMYGALSLLRLAIYGSGLPTSAIGIMIWALCVAGFMAVAYGLYRGCNVVRWLLALAVLASVVLFPLYKPEMPQGGMHLALYVLQLALPVLASALTLTPRARAWFRCRSRHV